MIRTVPIPTEAGEFVAHFSERGLAGLDFPGRRHRPQPQHADAAAADIPELPHWERLTANALRCMLAGKPPGTLPPFDWRGATEFQQNIWRALLRIPLGQQAPTLKWPQLPGIRALFAPPAAPAAPIRSRCWFRATASSRPAASLAVSRAGSTGNAGCSDAKAFNCRSQGPELRNR